MPNKDKSNQGQSNKQREETKVDELKKARKLIKALEDASIVSHQEVGRSDSRRREAERNAERLEKELTVVDGRVEQLQHKLEDIQKAIGTAAAMRYPDARIICEVNTYYIPQAEPRPQSDESEDVRLLRYLHGLCS